MCKIIDLNEWKRRRHVGRKRPTGGRLRRTDRLNTVGEPVSIGDLATQLLESLRQFE